MKLEQKVRLGDLGTQGHPERRVNRENLVPPEKKERPVMREMLAQMVPLGSGAALEKEDLAGPLV
ncbi:hypothetical protein OFB83_32940 [Escherichia coli]|nr:hypothetical protein [Escherichia coli]